MNYEPGRWDYSTPLFRELERVAEACESERIRMLVSIAASLEIIIKAKMVLARTADTASELHFKSIAESFRNMIDHIDAGVHDECLQDFHDGIQQLLEGP